MNSTAMLVPFQAGLEQKTVETKKTIVAAKKEKKERKVYALPGQKHDPPEEVRYVQLMQYSGQRVL